MCQAEHGENSKEERLRREEERQGSVLDLLSGLKSDASDIWKRWRLAKFVDSQFFQKVFALLVIVNAVLIGVQADISTDWEGWMWIELVFVSAFVAEIVLKLVAFRAWYWGDMWNVFDFVVVAVSTTELVFMMITGDGTSSGLSTLRLVRVLRVVRVMGIFQNLNMLVTAFIRAMKSAVWVAVLLVMVIYIFAILGRGFFGDTGSLELHCATENLQPGERCYPSNEATWAASNQFRNVPRSMATLLQVMTGDSWASEIAGPIGDVRPVAWFFFTIFVVVVALGLLNLLTGVFLESLMEITSERNLQADEGFKARKRKMLDLVGKLFEEFDVNQGNTLDGAELPAMLKALISHESDLEQVGLPYEKLKEACEIADYDHAHRSYDPATQKVYHEVYHWAPDFDADDTEGDGVVSKLEFQCAHGPENVAKFHAADTQGKGHLTRNEYVTEFGEASATLKKNKDGHLLPEGTMEGELIDCLMHMDEPLAKSDYFTLMKRIRLMERRLLVESSLQEQRLLEAIEERNGDSTCPEPCAHQP